MLFVFLQYIVPGSLIGFMSLNAQIFGGKGWFLSDFLFILSEIKHA